MDSSKQPLMDSTKHVHLDSEALFRQFNKIVLLPHNLQYIQIALSHHNLA